MSEENKIIHSMADENFASLAVSDPLLRNTLDPKTHDLPAGHSAMNNFHDNSCTKKYDIPQDVTDAETADATNTELIKVFKPVSAFEELEAEWLIKGWMPKGQITLLASEGGIGKTTIACNLIAAISSGDSCILDAEDDIQRMPQTVMVFTTEDSISQKLKKKLRLMGANMSNIIAPDPSADETGMITKLKFGSPELEQAIRAYKPALCVFDPIQGYVPPDINMGSRNAMRDCMARLTALGEEIGCTFLVICHSNKRKGAYGRDRISDSSYLWDISRSVIMAGRTEDREVRYLSNEKNNYAKLQETVLFRIDNDSLPVHEGFSEKRDYDYVMAAAKAAKSAAPFNERLFNALKEVASPFTSVRFHYGTFEAKYGETIWGGKQPAAALKAMIQPMSDANFSLSIMQFKVNGKNGKGFIISPIEELEQTTITQTASL